MHLLAIETSSFGGTLALLSDGQLVEERSLPAEERSAQSLAPAIQSLLADRSWPMSSIDLVAVAEGPGSFTGLRVGVTLAKTLAYAIGAEVIGVDTLEVLANQIAAAPQEFRIHPAIDAQRGQLCVARFLRSPGEPLAVRETDDHITDVPAWTSSFRSGDIVVGPKLPSLNLPPGVEILLEEPRASTVGRLAWRDYQAGRRGDVWSLAPRYHRPSAAEEKAALRKATGP